jgi:uncharacterized membrane protein (DUF485 family)
MRDQKPVMSVKRFSDVICSGSTISVGTIVRARSVTMFMTALYVRTARWSMFSSLARNILVYVVDLQDPCTLGW